MCRCSGSRSRSSRSAKPGSSANDPAAHHLRRTGSHADHNENTDYTDIEAVRSEVREARRVFAEHHWPVIDVTRRSIEETAAAIYKLLMRRRGTEA
jgi:regulator of PEP synthase PpsR (kinase-PPPase family)